MAQHVKTRAHDLRLTANGIRILHAVALNVRGANFAISHELTQNACDGDLATAEVLACEVERAALETSLLRPVHSTFKHGGADARGLDVVRDHAFEQVDIGAGLYRRGREAGLHERLQRARLTIEVAEQERVLRGLEQG